MEVSERGIVRESQYLNSRYKGFKKLCVLLLHADTPEEITVITSKSEDLSLTLSGTWRTAEDAILVCQHVGRLVGS